MVLPIARPEELFIRPKLYKSFVSSLRFFSLNNLFCSLFLDVKAFASVSKTLSTGWVVLVGSIKEYLPSGVCITDKVGTVVVIGGTGTSGVSLDTLGCNTSRSPCCCASSNSAFLFSCAILLFSLAACSSSLNL